MNLEACYLYKDIEEKKQLTSKNRNKIKLFSATMPYSLETIRINNVFKETFYEDDGKQYTNKIVNLVFNKNYTKWDENFTWQDKEGKEHKGKRLIIAEKKQIRKYFYTNGFTMDGIEYVFYKRGAGKAKNGFALYIQKDMKDKLIERSRLNLKFEEDEEVDLTSLLAYESLISSGIEFTINLDPKTEILLINDIDGIEFESMASVTKEEDGEIVTKNEEVKLQNCLSDGQGLLEESVFEQYSKQDKGMMLLRNDMFKCCAFNTKLQKWFEKNEKTIITDMFGNKYDASKIKLVTTPNSLKFLKFAYKFTESKTKEEYDKLTDGEKFEIDKKCYEHWKKNIDDLFGVVKCDKQGNFGNYNRLTYQLLNSIPNLTYDELMTITKLERDYVMLLKNDNAVFRNYLNSGIDETLKLEMDLEDDNLTLYEKTDLLSTLLLINSDIQYTKKFKKMKSEIISNYIKHLKEGKMRIKNTKYVTIFSNPYEMLLATIGKYDNKSIMSGREVYCKFYKPRQEFCISRNPHINAGNVMYAKNVYHDEYNWFNFTDNIMAVNFYDNDMPDRMQGEDTDSDTNLVIPTKILVDKALYCENNFPTPINRVKGSTKAKKYNMIELQKLDNVLSNNYIGRIVNMSQIINSYLNDAITRNESKEIIDELYRATSRLSSLSQIEIDKSKKVFENVNMSKELTKIRRIESIKYIEEKDKYGQMVYKMIVPEFFRMISDANEYRVFKKFNTPLDILQDILVFESANKPKDEINKELKDLLIQSKELDSRYQQNSANAIFKIIEFYGKKINGLKVKSCTLNDKAKKTVESRLKSEAVEKLKKKRPNDATILSILKQCFDEQEDKFGFKKYGMLTLGLLFIVKKKQVLKCFKKTNIDSDEVLVRMKENYDFNIFGTKYQKIPRGELDVKIIEI